MTRTLTPAMTVRALLACAGLVVLASPAAAQNIWQPQNIWNIPAPEVAITSPAGPPASNIAWSWTRRATGTQNPATGGRTSFALVTNGTGSAIENLDATRDRVQTALGQYSHTFNLSTAGGAAADILVPVLADANVNWIGPAANQARFKIQVDVQLFRQDPRPNPMAPLPGTFTAAGGLTTLDTGWFNDPGGARATAINQTWMQRYANQPTGERQYQLRTTIRAIAQADSAGVLGAAGSGVNYTFNSVNHQTSRGVTVSVAAEPANYANANSRNVISAPLARAKYNVTGNGVNVGIIEPGKTTNHASFGGRLTRANNGLAGNDNFDSEHTTAVASIIGSASANGAQRGVAPGANLITADTAEWAGTTAAINEMINNRFGAGSAGVINFSMKGGIANGQGLDSIIDANQNVTFVWAAGNDRLNQDNVNFNYVGTVPNPNYAYNNIAVGALDSTFGKMEDFSSNTQANYPTKPDVVAPGGYVLGASNRDLNNDGTLNDYTRSFVANQWSKTLNPNSPRYPEIGRISGTSFAAPHVSGIIALAHEYANNDAGRYDARAKDQRVMKAALIAGARTTGVVDTAGAGWVQQANTGSLTPASPLRVGRSLDVTLGGGVADAKGMLDIYSNKEARAADNNNQRNFQIDLRPTMLERTGFWDLETVGGMAGARPGTVDYLMGGSIVLDDFNNAQGLGSPISYLRVALTWNREVTGGAYDALDNLELELFIDGFTPMNLTGWDPAFGEADAVDYKIAFTENAAENVKLFDFEIPSLWLFGPDLVLNGMVTPASVSNFYLQVRNFSANDVEYGIAASFVPVPTPAGTTLLVFMGVVCAHRRRR